MLNMLPTDEQTQIIDSVRGFLRSELPLEQLRNRVAPEVSDSQWRAVAELGIFGMGLAESAGGIDFGATEEILVMRECGRVVATPSFMATILAAHLAHACSQTSWCRALISGERRASLVIAGPDSHAALLVDGRDNNLLVAIDSSSIALFESGFEPLRATNSLDESITLQSGRLDRRASACKLPYSSPLWLRASLLLAAQLVGLAEGARDLTVDYAKTRQQFGKPIGAFQAVKHRCADMAMLAEVAWAQTVVAAHALDAGATDAPLQVSCAKLMATTAAHRNGDHAIQVHGGIGYQAECDAHHFMKRSHVYDQAGGNRRHQAHSILEASRKPQENIACMRSMAR